VTAPGQPSVASGRVVSGGRRPSAASTGENGSDAKSVVNSVLRACSIMELLASERGDVPLARVASETGLTRPTAHRILATLEMAGWVRKAAGGRYGLTVKVFTIGSAAPEAATLREVARPVVAWLAAETGDTAYLLLPHEGRATCLERVEGPHPVRVHAVSVGGSIPMVGGGAPMAILAHRPDLLDEAAPSGRLRTHLRKRVEEILAQGYAMTTDDVIPGVSALGAAIFDASGRAVAGVSVTGTNDRFTGRELERRVQAVTRAAREISGLLRSAGTS
jgi:DNA-binding IclR family transcriptional regulator